MSIRRVKRPDRYTMISNEVFSSNLSTRAIGLLTYLLSKPDNWEVSVAHLVKHVATTERPDGRDSMYGIISELLRARFMVRTVSRNAGKMNGYDYDVFDEPQAEAPFTPEPDTAAPNTETPYTAEPTQINTEIQQVPKVQKTDIATTQSAVIDEVGSVVGDTQAKCRETWNAYCAAYSDRYGVQPVRNAKVNTQVKQLVQRIGVEAPEVAEFYVRSVNDAFIIRGFHDLGLMLSRCEAYRTQWATGRTMTQTRARQVDQSQANAAVADDAMALYRQMQERRNAQ